MKIILNPINSVILLFFFPLFLVDGYAGEESRIQEFKEKITEEKEKKAEKAKEEVKAEKKENKVEHKQKENKKEKKNEKHKEKENNKDKYKYKNEDKEKYVIKETPEERSRIQEVKDKIAEEKVKKESKKEQKVKEKYKHEDYHGYPYNRKYYKERYRYYEPGYFVRYRNRYDVFYGPLINVTYADYPYAEHSDFHSGSLYTEESPSRKIAFLNSSIETSYLGKDIRDTYGVTAKVSGSLYSLHLDYFFQRIFSSQESLTLYSINGGLSFATDNFILSPFLGAFYIDILEEAQLSYGANLQVFLPANFIIDLYSLNSKYGSLNFNNFSASANYAIYRFNVGLGYNYNNYAGVNFSGPLFKLSFWL